MLCDGCGNEIGQLEEYGEHAGQRYRAACVQEIADEGNELDGSL